MKRRSKNAWLLVSTLALRSMILLSAFVVATPSVSAELLPPTLCISNECAEPLDSAPANSTAIDWNPGHYFAISTERDRVDYNYQAQVDRSGICDPGNERVKGIRVGFMIREVWPTSTTFNFRGIRQVKNALRAENCQGIMRRIIVRIEARALDHKYASRGNVWAVPADLESSAVTWQRSNGQSRAIHRGWDPSDPFMRTHINNFIDTFAAEFADDPQIEGLQWGAESSVGNGVSDADPTYDRAKLDVGRRDIVARFRAAMPTTWVVNGAANFGRANETVEVAKYYDFITSAPGLGVGGPDIFVRPTFAAPTVAIQKILSPHKGEFVVAFEAQNPNLNRYINTEQLWEGCCNPAGWNPAHCDGSLNTPPSSGCSWNSTHMIWMLEKDIDGLRNSDRDATLARHDFQIASTRCPTAFTNNGATCISGRE